VTLGVVDSVPSKALSCARVRAHTGREMSIHKKPWSAQKCSFKKYANPDNGRLELLVIVKYHKVYSIHSIFIFEACIRRRYY